MTQIDLPLYFEWRKQMVSWQYSIAQTCKFRKDTVEIAVSMVDRLVAVQNELLSEPHRYQVACMACLYIAAKVHEEKCLTPSQMEVLSADRFSVKDIEAMEREVLTAIQFRVNPPTAAAFCNLLLDAIPIEQVSTEQRETIMDIAQSHIQLAIGEEYFLSVDASTLGLASLMTALQCVIVGEEHHSKDFNRLFQDLFNTLRLADDMKGSIQHTPFEIRHLRQQLRQLVLKSLSSGSILVHEVMTMAYQKPLQQQQELLHQQQQQLRQQQPQCGNKKGYPPRIPTHPGRTSPRSVVGSCRSVGVMI